MYRIALFGEPGSGKTTLSKLLAHRLGIRVIEASEEVIFPTARLPQLPEREELLAYIKKCEREDGHEPITRERAREVFSSLGSAFGEGFVAEALHEKFVHQAKGDYIFSGLRGLENAKYSRLHNDLVIYLRCDQRTLIGRLHEERGVTEKEALYELRDENARFNTQQIEAIASLVVNTSHNDIESCVSLILKKVEDWNRMCIRCVNVGRNPAMRFNEDGYCHICEAYFTHFDPAHLKEELHFLQTLKSEEGDYDAMIGISGGKDSTATLYQLKMMGFRPLAFTFDTGYLPETTIPRAREVAAKLNVDYEVIDVRHYLRDIDRQCYEKLAYLYELPFTLKTKSAFRDAYEESRRHYSVKCEHSPTFVRSCQICRRMVVRAYYGEASRRGIKVLVLGMNEWTNLSHSQSHSLAKVSGMRKLQPFVDKPAVHIFHLPFLQQRTIDDVERDLTGIGWEPPAGEDLIESNSNSCLLARSTERMAKRLLEFHPDSTRLAREVTVGFITKEQALAALQKIHPYKYSPREVLRRAKII